VGVGVHDGNLTRLQEELTTARTLVALDPTTAGAVDSGAAALEAELGAVAVSVPDDLVAGTVASRGTIDAGERDHEFQAPPLVNPLDPGSRPVAESTGSPTGRPRPRDE